MSESESNPVGVVLQWGKDNRSIKECLGWMRESPVDLLDLYLPWPRFGNDTLYAVCGLFIGINPLDKVISPNQKRAIQYLLSAGYDARIAWSANDAIEIIKEYIDPKEKRWIVYQI